MNCLICGPIAANSLEAFRTRTVLMVLIVLLKHPDLFKFSSACNEQESCGYPLYSGVIFGRRLITCEIFFCLVGFVF